MDENTVPSTLGVIGSLGHRLGHVGRLHIRRSYVGWHRDRCLGQQLQAGWQSNLDRLWSCSYVRATGTGLTWDPDVRNTSPPPPDRTGRTKGHIHNPHWHLLTCPPVLVPALGHLRAYHRCSIQPLSRMNAKAKQLARGTLLRTAEFKEATFTQAPQSNTNFKTLPGQRSCDHRVVRRVRSDDVTCAIGNVEMCTRAAQYGRQYRLRDPRQQEEGNKSRW